MTLDERFGQSVQWVLGEKLRFRQIYTQEKVPDTHSADKVPSVVIKAHLPWRPRGPKHAEDFGPVVIYNPVPQLDLTIRSAGVMMVVAFTCRLFVRWASEWYLRLIEHYSSHDSRSTYSASQSLDYDAPQCPPVHGIRVVIPLDNFGRLADMGQQTLTRRAIRCHTHKVFSRADLRLLDHFIYGRSEGSLTKLFALSMTSFCVPLRVLRILQIPCPAHSRGVSWPAYWGRLIGRGSPLNANSFDNPKSAKTQCPLALRSIFSGFRSRTMMPCLCLSIISHDGS